MAVLIDIEVQSRFGNVHLVALVFAQIDNQTARIDEFLLCLLFHLINGGYQFHVVNLVIDWIFGYYTCIADDKAGRLDRVVVLEFQPVDFYVGDIPDVTGNLSFGVEKDDFREIFFNVYRHVLDLDVGPAFLRKFGARVSLLINFTDGNQIITG